MSVSQRCADKYSRLIIARSAVILRNGN